MYIYTWPAPLQDCRLTAAVAPAPSLCGRPGAYRAATCIPDGAFYFAARTDSTGTPLPAVEPYSITLLGPFPLLRSIGSSAFAYLKVRAVLAWARCSCDLVPAGAGLNDTNWISTPDARHRACTPFTGPAPVRVHRLCRAQLHRGTRLQLRGGSGFWHAVRGGTTRRRGQHRVPWRCAQLPASVDLGCGGL